MTPFAELPRLVLGPLEGRPDDIWFRAVEGVWSPGQIVDHVAAAIDRSAGAFESRANKPPMTRRPRSLWQILAWQVVSRTGLFGPRRRAPEVSLPSQRPERAATEQRLRDGVARFLELERRLLPRRAADLFARHPVFGDLTIGEFMTFHVRHAEHHVKQIRARV